MTLTWHGWFIAGHQSTVPGGPVTAVPARQDRVDLFIAATPNGEVYTTRNRTIGGALEFDEWSTVAQGTSTSGAPVMAVLTRPDEITLFSTAWNGEIYTNSGFGTDWGGWHDVQEGSTIPGGWVTAVQTRPDQIALFLADPNGGIYTNLGFGRTDWSAWHDVAQGSSTPGARVTPVLTGQQEITLFITDPNGGIYTASGFDRDWGGGWTIVDGIRSAPGSPVTAVVPSEQHVDLFITDANGDIYTNWRDGNRWSGWQPVAQGSSTPGAPITALLTGPQEITLFITDRNGGIYTNSGFNSRFGNDWGGWTIIDGVRSTPGAPVTAVPLGPQLAVCVADRDLGRINTALSRFDAPAAPTDLRVTDVADRRISVAWTDHSDNEDGFRIRFRGQAVSGQETLPDHTGTISVGRNVVSASLTDLKSGYEYTISVTAFDAAGESGSSNEVRATTPARVISVSSEGAGQSTVFVVSGTGFTPNSLVVFQIANQRLSVSAGGDGKFASRNSFPCQSGLSFKVLAWEDTDPTGTVSNTVTITCP
jgi:Fibronectin type III domain